MQSRRWGASNTRTKSPTARLCLTSPTKVHAAGLPVILIVSAHVAFGSAGLPEHPTLQRPPIIQTCIPECQQPQRHQREQLANLLAPPSEVGSHATFPTRKPGPVQNELETFIREFILHWGFPLATRACPGHRPNPVLRVTMIYLHIMSLKDLTKASTAPSAAGWQADVSEYA